MKMKPSCVELIDLPDELLIIIFKKLSNVQILYSLMDVNIRFSKILLDEMFTSCLTMLRVSSDGFIHPAGNNILDRFCSEILPKIHDKIKWLNLESLSMERILLAIDYPNLHGLGLYNMDKERAIRLFRDGIGLTPILKSNISRLIITISEKIKGPTDDVMDTVCTHAFTVLTNLSYLNFHSTSYRNIRWFSFRRRPPAFFSSNLTELHIYLTYFNDCLYLLDGRFSQLRTFYVNIKVILPPSSIIDNKEKLSNLRCFSLAFEHNVTFYNELVVPLLQRMSNLESLSLYFSICYLDTFVDGNSLKKDIISHMTQLNKFIFNICSTIYVDDQINLPSNEDIQRTLTCLPKNQVITCVDYFPKRQEGQCHIYSEPYTLTHYHNITNNFSGALFKCVREISLFDERPFQHEFFIRIGQAFPFITKLSLTNRKAQKHKEIHKNEYLSIIEYPRLVELNFIYVHQDYVIQFLDNSKTHLINPVRLNIDYQPLQKATRNFKRDTTRVNSAKLNQLHITRRYQMSKHLQDYFPNAKIF